MTEQTIGMLEASRQAEVSPVRFRNLAEIILRHQTDEELAPLAESITDSLRSEGLNQTYDDLGISRFLGFTEKERRKMETGWGVNKSDGKFGLLFHTEQNKTVYKKKDDIPVAHIPVTIGEQIAAYLSQTPHHRKFHFSLARIHECIHHYNWERTAKFLKKSHRDTTAGFIFREAHSYLAHQQLGFKLSDEEFISLYSSAHRKSDEPSKTLRPEDDQHEQAKFHPQGEDMARYATGVIWRLRALALNEREIGEKIAMFQREDMLNWNSENQVCPSLESWIENQMNNQKLSKKDIEAKILEIKQGIERNNQRTQEIIEEKVTGYLVNLDYADIKVQTENLIITGQLPIGGVRQPKGTFWEVRLHPGFQLKAEKINFQNMQSQTYQTDGFSASAWVKSLLEDSPNSPVEEKVNRHLAQISDPMKVSSTQKLAIEEGIKLLREKQEVIDDGFRQRKIAETLNKLTALPI